jgi:predicted nuclease of predicted toxin-antitoxin system
MKFLLDHCVPLKIKPLLEKLGHSVITLKELGKASAPDPEVIKLSTTLTSILITCDFLHRAYTSINNELRILRNAKI